MRSSAEPPVARTGAFAWPAVAAAFAVAATLLAQFGDAARLAHVPSLATGEPWRAWTSALVHLSPLHLAANVAGAVAVGALGAVARLRWPFALAWLVSWPLAQVALLLRPDLERYAGLSGVLHAGVAIAAVALVARADRPRRIVGVLLLAGLIAKVIFEAPWREALRQVPGWDIAIAPFAHASGLAVGLAAGVVAALLIGSRDASGAPSAGLAGACASRSLPELARGDAAAQERKPS